MRNHTLEIEAQRPLHITEFADDYKSARTLSRAVLVDDEYHARVAESARALVELSASELIYTAQWASGATLWVDDIRNPTTCATVVHGVVRYSGRR
jgi:hypothetical protein